MKKGINFYNGMLFILLIISILFKDKLIYLAPNLNISASIITYSLTFLVLGITLTKYGFGQTKESLKNSVFFSFIFMLIIFILCNIPSNIEFVNNELILRELFVPNSIVIKGFNLYYVDISLFFYLGVYYLTHYIFISINDVITYMSNKYLGFGMSIFISFIIDVMFMVPVFYYFEIYYGIIDFLDIIKILTANYMVLIILSLISLVFYALIAQKKSN